MQDMSNMITRWAISLHCLDFTVHNKPGAFNVSPNFFSRLFKLDSVENSRAPALEPIPISYNVPKIEHFTRLSHRGITAYRQTISTPVSQSILPGIYFTPQRQYSELFLSIDRDRLREFQQIEHGRCIVYIHNTQAGLPQAESSSTLLHYFVNDVLLFFCTSTASCSPSSNPWLP